MIKNTLNIVMVLYLFVLTSTTGLAAEKKIPTLKLLKRHSSVYLDDMQEDGYTVRTGFVLGKRGATGYTNGSPTEVQFQGNKPEHCLSIHGRTQEESLAQAVYKLDKNYTRLTCTVGFSKTNRDPLSKVVFQVLGDNKILWKSAPATTNTFTEDVDIKIKGCRELILQVVVAGSETAATSIFVDPQLWHKPDVVPQVLRSRRE